MGITRVTITKNSKPTKEQLEQIEAAAKMPITYDEDCPELTPAQQKVFAALAELRQVKRA